MSSVRRLLSNQVISEGSQLRLMFEENTQSYVKTKNTAEESNSHGLGKSKTISEDHPHR